MMTVTTIRDEVAFISAYGQSITGSSWNMRQAVELQRWVQHLSERAVIEECDSIHSVASDLDDALAAAVSTKDPPSHSTCEQIARLIRSLESLPYTGQLYAREFGWN